MEDPQEAASSPTSFKRKLDEAFDAIDDALQTKGRCQSPPKRANTSIYGSLAKYGIRSLVPSSTSKTTSTPTLTALLSRSRSRKQNIRSSIPHFSRTSSATPDYSPSSTEAFLQRLSTFSLPSYGSKPPQIDAVAASKAGWINEGGKDRLFCAICKMGWVVAGRTGLSKDAANSLVEKQRQSLVDMHKEGCPWRVRQCDSLVYRIPLQSPTGLARQIKTRAAELELVLEGIAIRHPLSSAQVQSFVQTVSSVPDPPVLSQSSSSSPPPEFAAPPTSLPSSTSLLISLFGWSIVPTRPLTRTSSSATLTLARTHSRTSSAQSIAAPSRESTPSPGTSCNVTPFSTPNSLRTTFNTPENGKTSNSLDTIGTPSPMLSHREPPQQKDPMLQCQMCQRRVGLWAFAMPQSNITGPSQPSSPNGANTINSRPQRHFDLMREHRSYCPYVVKSTPLPSLPSQSAASAATPRASFNLARTVTSSSLSEAQGSTSTPFSLGRTTSVLSGMSSFARTGSLSTITPPSSEYNHNITEGWRAIFSVVLRYGIAERSRLMAHPHSNGVSAPGALPPGPVSEERVQSEDDAMNSVVALVEGVKQHGGKQILNYVRGLLG